MDRSLKAGHPITLPLGKHQSTFRHVRCDGEAPLPGIGVQARNLATAAVDVVRGLVAGSGLKADDAEKARRRAICVSNACGQYRASDDRCAACGCWKRAKTWLTASRCPVGRW